MKTITNGPCLVCSHDLEDHAKKGRCLIIGCDCRRYAGFG